MFSRLPTDGHNHLGTVLIPFGCRHGRLQYLHPPRHPATNERIYIYTMAQSYMPYACITYIYI